MFARRILLATDGSEEATRAARMAIELSSSLDSELHMIYVGPAPGYGYDVPEWQRLNAEAAARVHERAAQESRIKLEELVQRVREAGGKVAGTYARVGRADAQIVVLAEAVGVGLVVVGSRGLGGMRRALMGSVSMNVVRHAHCSVLVVRGYGDEEGQGYLPAKILVAFDGSEKAAAASRVATELANATGSELHLVYVVRAEPYVLPYDRLPYEGVEAWEGWEDSIERAERQARSFVEGQARRMEAQGARVAEAHLAFGEPDEQIVELADELKAGLIVVGSRGLGGVRRALIGSVSESVVRHAHCPVLVVREVP